MKPNHQNSSLVNYLELNLMIIMMRLLFHDDFAFDENDDNSTDYQF